MICPKCGQQSDNLTTCSHCGIIFKKYAAQNERERVLEQTRWERAQQRKRQFVIAASVAAAGLLGILGLTTCETAPEQSTPQFSQTPNARQQMEAKIAEFSGKGYYLWEDRDSRFVVDEHLGDLTQSKRKLIFVNESRTGYGAHGFLITDRCHAIVGRALGLGAITNTRSTSALSSANYESYSQELAEAEATLEQRRKAFIESCSDCSQAAHDKALKRELQKVERLRDQITAIERGALLARNGRTDDNRLTAKTDFGTVEARLIEASERYQLSLVILDHAQCEYLTRASAGSQMEQATVFAFSGLRSSQLNAGVLSGETRLSGSVNALQHTIGLREGDRGTPLLNRDGEVIAINQTTADGSTRAIPVDTALRILKMPL